MRSRITLTGLFVLSAMLSGQEKPDPRLTERAHQDRDIVYFLQSPETHSFDLFHDYTESRAGVDKYLNVVRKGSRASKPSARVLDTGETLTAQTLRGDEIAHAALDIGEPVRPDSEVVVIRFPAVQKGRSVRLRISETYTDEKSYRMEGEELVFDRSFGRPHNAVVLPAGWYLTACAIPATVSQMPDGRIRLDFVNPRPDEIAVLIRAKRRKSPSLSVGFPGRQGISRNAGASAARVIRAGAGADASAHSDLPELLRQGCVTENKREALS